jgi:hypothetical protein
VRAFGRSLYPIRKAAVSGCGDSMFDITKQAIKRLTGRCLKSKAREVITVAKYEMYIANADIKFKFLVCNEAYVLVCGIAHILDI